MSAAELKALPTPADPDIVMALERALERAKTGEMQHFVLVELNARWEAKTERCCTRYAAMVMVGALELVKHRLVDHANANDG